MLILGSKFINQSVMSLHTGTKIAIIKKPLIDPSNLFITAYEIESSLLNNKSAYLRLADVREYGKLGFIVDSIDEFIDAKDVIKIQQLIDLHFEIVGLNVIDEHKHKLGKISDYTVDSSSFSIQQIQVKKGFFNSLSDSEILIHRSQIVEINNTSVIVKSAKPKVTERTPRRQDLTYVNPFRNPIPQQD